MATTYSVTNTFTADTTAVASEVNANFQNILDAINAFDAANLSSGTLPLARISGLTSTQMSSALFKDEDDMASDSATAVASQQSVKYYVDNTYITGQTIQTVYDSMTSAVDLQTSCTIPSDDTVPQNDEGIEFLTQSITPTSTSNKLKIEVQFNFSCIAASYVIIGALFQDSDADAIAVAFSQSNSADDMNTLTLTHFVTAGTTDATTFKLRVGRADTGANITMNGKDDDSGTRLFGGVCYSGISITEIQV